MKATCRPARVSRSISDACPTSRPRLSAPRLKPSASAFSRTREAAMTSEDDFKAMDHAFGVLNHTANWLDGVAKVLAVRLQREGEMMDPEPWDELPIEKDHVEALLKGLATAALNLRE